jgi:hypothetical protein
MKIVMVKSIAALVAAGGMSLAVFPASATPGLDRGLAAGLQVEKAGCGPWGCAPGWRGPGYGYGYGHRPYWPHRYGWRPGPWGWRHRYGWGGPGWGPRW